MWDLLGEEQLAEYRRWHAENIHAKGLQAKLIDNLAASED
jgi:hypothetical protein